MTFTPTTPAQNTLSAVIDSTSNLSVLCTNTTPYSVSLNGGNTGTIAQRLLVSSGVNVNYNLYTDNTYGTIWGDGTTGKTVGLNGSTVVQSSGGTLGGAGTGATQTLTIYGQVAAPQAAVAPGTYTDNIIATVNF
jgi:spore coat protein U-like protein